MALGSTLPAVNQKGTYIGKASSRNHPPAHTSFMRAFVNFTLTLSHAHGWKASSFVDHTPLKVWPSVLHGLPARVCPVPQDGFKRKHFCALPFSSAGAWRVGVCFFMSLCVSQNTKHRASHTLWT